MEITRAERMNRACAAFVEAMKPGAGGVPRSGEAGGGEV